MADLYRDPLAGLRGQIETKRAVLEDRRRLVTPIVRSLVEPWVRLRIEQEPPPFGDDDMASLSAADAWFDDAIAACDVALGRASKLRRCRDDLPDPPYAGLPPPWLLEEAPHRHMRSLLEPLVSGVDPDAYITRWGDFAYLARMRVHYEPVVYRTSFSAETYAYEALVRTTVPSGLCALEVKPERLYHSASRALHLAREIEVGDPAFDEAFWITGDATTATLLVPEVRAALVALHARGLAPVMSVDGGVVTLTYGGGVGERSSDLLPREALDAALGVRAAVASG